MFKMYKDVQYSFSDNLINALIAVLFMNSYIHIYIFIKIYCISSESLYITMKIYILCLTIVIRQQLRKDCSR